MKTITEFDGFKIANAVQSKKTLAESGKTPEEISQTLGESFKLEGDKLTYFLAAVELAETRPERLKRVLVMSGQEGEKAPSGAVQKGDKHYLAEYFFVPQQHKPRAEHRGRPGDRDKGKRGGKRGGRFKGKPREGAQGQPGEARAAEGPGEAGADQRRRRPPRRRPPQGPRKEGAPQSAGAGAKPNVKPNVTPNSVPPKPEATEASENKQS